MDTSSLTFDEFLSTQSYQVPVYGFLFNLLLAGILAFILSQAYIRYGTSLSNRRAFAKNFMLIAMTTMFIITVVKSSLALSLGLVGALSIVRFRTAIKEPEELAFLFLVIAVGLGLGADQLLITTITILFIIAIIIIKSKATKKNILEQNFHLTISDYKPDSHMLSMVKNVILEHCSSAELKRFDESNEIFEATFNVNVDKIEDLITLKNDMKQISASIRVHFLDNKGII